jgi:hypothetical protein
LPLLHLRTFLPLTTVVAVGATLPQTADAQATIPRITGTITLDGMSDEPAWDGIAPLEMTVYQPTFGAEPSERTEIRIGHDDDFLYLAGRLYDSGAPRTGTLYRDEFGNDDVLAILLDTYNDHETAVWFATSPAGVRTDRTVFNDGEFRGSMPMNTDWNAFWDVATQENDEGWFAEFRIPFSSLGFQDRDGQVEMGLIVYRLIARHNERHVYPAIPPNWEMGFAKPSQSRRVRFDGVYTQRPLYVTPYLLGGVRQSPELNQAGTAFGTTRDLTHEAGVDLKLQPSSSITVDLTVNTDFAQVEADDQQINLTRFSLFFPEKRQFFQERSSVFEFNTGGMSRLFHSRRIGLVDGEQVRLYGGARLVGRAGGFDVGVLAMQTAASAASPSENFGVLRLKRQVFNPNSTIGIIGTSRVGMDGTYNVGVGVDAVLRPFGQDYVTVKWAETWDDTDVGSKTFIDGARVMLAWERRTQSGLRYLAGYTRSGNRYDPDLGFTLRRDFTHVQSEVGYRWLMGPRTAFRSIGVDLRGETYLRNVDRSVESGAATPTLRAEFKSGHELQLGATSSYEALQDTFLLSAVTPVVPGRYRFHEARVRFEYSRARMFRPSVQASAGTFYDGWRASVSVTPSWNVSPHLQLSGGYTVNAIRFSDRGTSLTTHLARLRIRTALNVHLSFVTLAQYNSTSDDISLNARLRYHFGEGRDLWIVYNEGLALERPLGASPRQPLSLGRSLAIKYTHTFVN